MAARRLLYAAALVCAAALALVAYVRRPEHAFLVGRDGATWIRAERPFELVARRLAPEIALLRHRFTLPGPGPVPDGVLHVQALRSFRLFVNDRVVGSGSAEESTWRYPRSFDLSPYLVHGSNELRLEVENDRGPPALLAWSPGLGIATGAGWEAPGPDGKWAPVMAARDARNHPLSTEFPSAWRGLLETWGWLFGAFVLGAGASLAYSRWLASAARIRWRPGPAQVRWLALGALALLGLHNLGLVNSEMGFDAPSHFDYIRYVVTAHRVPLANEGWQFFQPPLFYLLAAPPYLLVTRLASEGAAMLTARALVLACALGLVEMVYRAARAAFPARGDLQMIATATGGFLPMTVYMSSYVSNEPLSAVLTAALVVAAFRLLADADPNLERWSFFIGVLFGFALLAKVTVALLLPLLAVVLLRTALRRDPSPRAALGPLLRFAVASGSVAGWYFVRNWIRMGSAYLGGWDPKRGGAWIQDPGYRTSEHLLSFGASLRFPIYSGLSSLWDAIYSTFWLDGFLGSSIWSIGAPPWHYYYAVACALLALPLSAAGIAGWVRALRVPRGATQEALLFSALAVALYFAAIFALFVRLPIYSTVKSTYTMGLAPCYGVLFASGFDLLPRRAAVRALLVGYLSAWLTFVFRAYFS